MAPPVFLNVLNVSVVQFGEVASRLGVRPQELIDLSVDCLCVAMFSSIDVQRHRPCRQRRDGAPAKDLR